MAAKAQGLDVLNKQKGVPNLKEQDAQFVFVDDDGHGEVWTRLRPIFNRQGVPFCSAVITKNFGVSGLTTAQIITLHKEGHEILSHTHDHLGFNSIKFASLLY